MNGYAVVHGCGCGAIGRIFVIGCALAMVCLQAVAQTPPTLSLQALDWQSHPPPAGYPYCFSPHPNDETPWFVCSFTGLYISNDSGQSYRRVGSGVYCPNVAFDPRDSNRVVLICGHEGVYISSDRGSSWVLRRINTSEFLATPFISPRDGAIFVGPSNTVSQHGIFRSMDQGSTFQFYSFGSSYRQLIIWAISEDPETGTLYAGTEIANHPKPYKPPLFRSLDRGRTWEEVSGVIPWHVVSFEYSPLTREMFALTEGSGIFKTADQGRTWTYLSTGPSIQILRDPKEPERFWGTRQSTVSHGDSVLYSPDRGAKWFPAGLPDVNTKITINTTGTKMYAGTYPPGLNTATMFTPKINFSVLTGTDGADIAFACNPIKLFSAVRLTLDGNDVTVKQVVIAAPGSVNSIMCSFRVPPGTFPGDHLARLGLDTNSISFTVQVTQGTAAALTGMTNVLFSTPPQFAPGDIVSIFGVRLTRPSITVGTANLASPPFPLLLNQSRVLVFSNNRFSYQAAMQLAFTDAATGVSQINVQLPTNLPDGSYRLRVDRLTTQGGVDSSTELMDFLVGPYQPLFLGNAAYPVFLQNITQDPLGQVFASAEHPARRGDVLTLYATGMGATSPLIRAGFLPAGLAPIVAQPLNRLETAGGKLTTIAPIGGIIASPQFPGLYQMSIQLPPDLDVSEGVVLRHELGSLRINVSIPIEQ